MQKYDHTKPLAFIHIPKTAGSSIQYILHEWFGDNLIRFYFNDEKIERPKKANLKDSNGIFIPDLCVTGHFNRQREMGIEQCFPEIGQYITFLRDPFEVHISNYFYVQKLALKNKAFRNGKLHPIIENNLSLQEYLQQNKKSFFLNFLPAEINENNYKDILKDKFLYIGISENFDDSIRHMASFLDKKPINSVYKNKSKRDETIKDLERHKEYFYQHNYLEKKIYDFVKENYKTWAQL